MDRRFDDSTGTKYKLLTEIAEYSQQAILARLLGSRDPQKDAEQLTAAIGAFGVIKAGLSMDDEPAIEEMTQWIKKERNYHKAEFFPGRPPSEAAKQV